MKKSILVAAALFAGSTTFAQKKMKQPPPPPPPPPIENLKEVPPPPPPPLIKADMAKDYKHFLQRNPTVKGISWNNNKQVRIHLKSGKDEVFDMNNKEDVEKLKNQYGDLPAPPPPPPPPPAPKKPGHITES